MDEYMVEVFFVGGIAIGAVVATWYWRRMMFRRLKTNDEQWHKVLSKWQADNARKRIQESEYA